MQARDVMETHVITVAPDTDVREIARRLIQNRISAVPVVDVSEHLSASSAKATLCDVRNQKWDTAIPGGCRCCYFPKRKHENT